MSGKVLVTGATGFLGGRLVRALCAAGERVRVLARPTSRLRGLDDVAFERCDGDIRIEHTVFRALAGCDRLYHCAAVYALWADDPRTITEGAVMGTEAVLRAARARGLERVVYTSTTYTIGQTHGPEALDETHPWHDPRGPVYAIAKRRAEEWAFEYARKTGLPLVVVNPSSMYGPGDWKPTPTAASVLEVLRAPVIPGLGTLVPIAPGGFSVADVDDVARGHVLAMERGRIGERYILGGENMSLADLFATVAQLVGKPAPKLRVGRGAAFGAAIFLEGLAKITGDAPPVSMDVVRGSFGDYFWVSSAKAERELGYVHRPGRVALARAIRFFLDHGYVEPEIARGLRLDPTALGAA